MSNSDRPIRRDSGFLDIAGAPVANPGSRYILAGPRTGGFKRVGLRLIGQPLRTIFSKFCKLPNQAAKKSVRHASASDASSIPLFVASISVEGYEDYDGD